MSLEPVDASYSNGHEAVSAPRRDTLSPSKQERELIVSRTDGMNLKGRAKKKKKPAKKVGLEEFVIDNELRGMVGLKKLKVNAPAEVVEKSEECTERKGIRKEKKLTPAKKKILKTRENLEILDSEIVSFSYTPTPMDEMVIDLLKRLRKQADAVHEVNQTKARSKRTFVCGLHESLKHVRAENVKCVIVARNLDDELISGPSLFHSLRDECINRRIPIVHASTKRLLSRALQKFPYTNIIALFHFHGFEELYCGIIQQWKTSDSHIQYHADQRSLFA